MGLKLKVSIRQLRTSPGTFVEAPYLGSVPRKAVDSSPHT